MPVTDGMLIAFFAGSGRRPSLNVAQRTAVLNALTAGINPRDEAGNPRAAINDDLADWLYDRMANDAVRHLRLLAGEDIEFARL